MKGRKGPIKCHTEHDEHGKLEVVITPMYPRIGMGARKIAIKEEHFWMYHPQLNASHRQCMATLAMLIVEQFDLGLQTKTVLVRIATKIEEAIVDALHTPPPAPAERKQIGEADLIVRPHKGSDVPEETMTVPVFEDQFDMTEREVTAVDIVKDTNPMGDDV